ncbi:polymer-forming cytoskeletal protein [Amaricoccus sp.]|uniref:bactofilin family protein n=1 Tax=Amaricoccus sp. TaxID=1872485 RepID=UPI00261193AC|nr:polymer-forming cytoskeletal protein [Amaricoccus sp.]HRO10554.1 polymer-forming cytoskeletal protein [Amaricoccus sp.]
MFSRSKHEDTPPPPQPAKAQGEAPSVLFDPKPAAAPAMAAPAAPKAKPAPSVLSSDLTIIGNVKSSGDIQVEGIVEGDVRAQVLIVGESATVKGEVIADEVVVHGRVVGRLRGLKVRLSASARCEGDIVHKTIAIESGAHFEGSVQRQDDPLGKSGKSEPQRQVVAAE